LPYKDKDKQKAFILEYRHRKRAWVAELKLKRGCDLCGYNRSPLALQYHHRDSSEKFQGISRMVNNGKSRESILLEISRCSLLCANCHAVLQEDQGSIPVMEPK
jgi:hypothetical protein